MKNGASEDFLELYEHSKNKTQKGKLRYIFAFYHEIMIPLMTKSKTSGYNPADHTIANVLDGYKRDMLLNLVNALDELEEACKGTKYSFGIHQDVRKHLQSLKPSLEQHTLPTNWGTFAVPKHDVIFEFEDEKNRLNPH